MYVSKSTNLFNNFFIPEEASFENRKTHTHITLKKRLSINIRDSIELQCILKKSFYKLGLSTLDGISVFSQVQMFKWIHMHELSIIAEVFSTNSKGRCKSYLKVSCAETFFVILILVFQSFLINLATKLNTED